MASKEIRPEGAPAYLERWPGLYERRAGRVVEAPASDAAVARGYPSWKDKGRPVAGRRLTLLTDRATRRVGEVVRVIHVVEVLEPGHEVFVAGPKAIYGEFVDGRLVTPSPPAGADALAPEDYDGPTLASPAVDYGYDLTSYAFQEPGRHTIVWRLGELESNTLEIEVS